MHLKQYYQTIGSPHFSSGMVERAKRFLAWGDFHARSRFARSTIPEEKWGTTRSLNLIYGILFSLNMVFSTIDVDTMS